MSNKFKSFIYSDQVFTICILILVGVISFGLGRLSTEPVNLVKSHDYPAVVLLSEEQYDDRLTIPYEERTSDTVAASINGTRYYSLNCDALERIAPQNRIYFVDRERALAAGYTPATSCVF